MKTQKSTQGYYDFEGSSYEDVLRSAKKEGYNFLFRWINSDKSWIFFQTTALKAEKAAAELYLKERGHKFSGMNLTEAKKYYSEFVDIIKITDELKNL